MLIHFNVAADGGLQENVGTVEQAIWIDLLDPTPQERAQIQNAFQIELPLHHELFQLEYSNRFYEENNHLFFSFSIVTKAAPLPESHVMTYILSKERFITIRYSDPNPIDGFIDQIKKHQIKVNVPSDIFIQLVNKMVGRIADLFELIGTQTEDLALSLITTVSSRVGSKSNERLNFTLLGINKLENLLSKNYQSLGSMSLMINFIHHYEHDYLNPKALIELETIKQDVFNLHKYGDYLNQKIGFQLNSNLGLINIQQNQIIKVFTVLATVFMPPTLIASIYGMNFKNMPELSTQYGYPVALIAMVLAAVLPYQFFKRKGWI